MTPAHLCHLLVGTGWWEPEPVLTIHGSNMPIDALPEAESYLTQIRIPAARKLYFRNVLYVFGITRSSLFPDSENLAQELAIRDCAP